MLKILAVIPIALLIVAGCRKKEKCEPDTYSYSFRNNAAVDTGTHNGQIPLYAFATNGNRRVFAYLHAHKPCDANIVDGFTSSNLFFEVDQSVDHFSFHDDDLADGRCYFVYYTDGYTINGAYIPTAGTIEGVRINASTWNVHFDLKLKNNQSLSGAGRFVIEQ